ncbi:MAG: iron-sulfur cluster-binding protein [Gemmatimonadetes bacterium]|nr:iron-sulfur cluster-binding protein [Gemmatimonadota bacterium]
MPKPIPAPSTTQSQPSTPAKVAVLFTSPESVVEDIGRVMEMAGYSEAIPVGPNVNLKINISWHHYYPACSTTPWQLDGVIGKLLADGYPRETLVACQNGTVVVDPYVGAERNKIDPVVAKHGLDYSYLNEPQVEWVRIEPKAKLHALNDVYPDGVHVPKKFFGESIIHLPTVKTHVFTTMTGAMKNAFGGLLNNRRHWTHSVIHETLVDLLAIQKEIHSGVFAVMDGTIAGDGPGPRCMKPHIKNVLLASKDQVAIDSISAKLMGFDPMSLKFIRMAHEDGLGCGDPGEIEIVGEEIKNVNWHFEGKKDTFASRGQKMIYHGGLKPLEHLLLRTPLVPWSYLASRFYHDGLWYPLIGKRRVAEIMKTDWGRLFQSY